jgi:hypothetical protein
VLLLFNALWHVHEVADFERCMRCVRQHLQPGGIFVLSLYIPAISILARDPDKRYPFSSYIDRKSGMRVLEEFGDWDRTPFGPESNNQIFICEAAR